jgi:hypothetical protein
MIILLLAGALILGTVLLSIRDFVVALWRPRGASTLAELLDRPL